MVNFCGTKSVPPTSSIKMRNCQKKLAHVYVYTRAYTQIRERGYIPWPGFCFRQVHIWQLGVHCWLCRPGSNFRWVQNSFEYVQWQSPFIQGCVITWMFAGVQRKAFQQTTSVLSSLPVAPSDIHFARFLQIYFFSIMVLMLLRRFSLPGFCKSVSFLPWFWCYFRH